MFMVTNLFSVLIPLYGVAGLWSDKVGYHHVRDFWLYNIVFGLFQAPYYAYAQTMMSEVTPRGYEGMFFGLFGITNRAVCVHSSLCVTCFDQSNSIFRSPLSSGLT
jgi:MFS-type transporter involved in bile tolerance (Atg22 family)